MYRRQLLLSFFDLLYTRLAWAYDLVAATVSAGQWYEWGRAALPHVEAGPVLEVGCGRGRLLGRLASPGHSVFGVDRSLQMAQAAARHSGKPVVRADGRALPFREGSFASLVTTFPASYVEELETQREFARVVRPGGRWIWIDAPALHPGGRTLFASLLTRLAEGGSTVNRAREAALRTAQGDGLWCMGVHRVRFGASSVAVRVAHRRIDPPTAG